MVARSFFHKHPAFIIHTLPLQHLGLLYTGCEGIAIQSIIRFGNGLEDSKNEIIDYRALKRAESVNGGVLVHVSCRAIRFICEKMQYMWGIVWGIIIYTIKKTQQIHLSPCYYYGGADETRTRDPRRDRPLL